MRPSAATRRGSASSPRATRCSITSQTRLHARSAREPVPSQEQRAAAFQALHTGDPFVILNPWDAGSAKVFEALGFKALATTSSGFAFTLGRLDGAAALDAVIEHTRQLDGAT